MDQQHDCKTELRQVSLKATPARLAILRLLEKTNTPLDIMAINDYLKRHDVSTDPATIFRIMHSFTDKGLAKQVNFNEGKTRYELSAKEDHHHLLCERCGNIEDISDCAIGDLEQDIQKKKGFAVTSHALEFFGICKQCQR